MSKETVNFFDKDIRNIIRGQVVGVEGHKFVHGDHYDEVDGSPHIITNGTIDRLVNGEYARWFDVRLSYNGTKFNGCDFAPSPGNPGVKEYVDGVLNQDDSYNTEPYILRDEEDDDSPQAVLSELQDTFEEKNADYGNSWEKIGAIKRVIADDDGPNIVYLYPDGEYTTSPDESKDNEAVEAVVLADTPQNQSTFQENADGVITRLLDKIIRAYNLIILADEPQVENESSADAAEDASGYSAMLASLIRRQ